MVFPMNWRRISSFMHASCSKRRGIMNHVIFTMLKVSLILRCIILDYVNEYLLAYRYA
jgi:hypothetical protein